MVIVAEVTPVPAPKDLQVVPDRNCHWYVSGAEPVAVTLKVAVLPTVTVWLVGCAVMPGGELTVSVTELLAVDRPLPAVTITLS